MIGFFSCQKDDDTLLKHENTASSTKTNYSISKIDYQTIQQNNRLVNSLTKIKGKGEVNNSGSQNRIVHSTTYDFYIDTDIATYIENADGSYHSYTFPIFRDSPTITLENLLFSLQDDGTYKVSIVSYDITESEKEALYSGKYVDLTTKTSIETIDGQALIDETLAFMDSGKCSDVLFEYCTESADHSDGSSCGYIGSGIFTICSGGSNTDPDNPDNSDVPDGENNSGGGVSNIPNNSNNDATSPTIFISYEEQIINCLGTFILNGNSSIQTWLSNANQRDKKALANYLGSSVNSGMGNGGETNCSNPDALEFAIEAIEALLNNEVETIEEFLDQENLPCPGDPVSNPEITSSGASGKRGGTFGCTRTGTICEGVSGKKMHKGMDIKADVNTNSYAMYSGVVTNLRNTLAPSEYRSRSYGNYVILSVQINGSNYFIKYNHLNSVSVTVGQEVNAGDIIGLNGNTGNAASKGVTPHIHIQVLDSNWNDIDPAPFLGTQFDSNYNPIVNPNC